ncbi:MAG: Uma2 family endonuclease [Thermaceae bacterium]|nr:Uma2 family endonuclease [Thermaceae bacterium]
MEDYLEAEAASDMWHEYVDGTLVAMAAETMRHDDIVLNVVEALRPVARAKGCKLHATSIRTRVRATRYRYPDVVVSCEAMMDARQLEHPCFILEVLSESTADTDTGKKLEEYTKLPSMQTYLIVAQTEPRVVVYERDSGGWRVEVLEGQGEIRVACLQANLSLEAIYAGVNFGE